MVDAIEQSDGRDDMNRCDWVDCLEVGVFDGVASTLLAAKGQKNIREVSRRFVYLCPEHFKLALATSNDENPPQPETA